MDSISKVVEEINKENLKNDSFKELKLYNNPNVRYYDKWYKGYDGNFHNFVDDAIVSRCDRKKSLKLGSIVCNEWSSMLQIEDKFISIANEKTKTLESNGASANKVDEVLKDILLQNDFYAKSTLSFKRAMGHGYSLILPINKGKGIVDINYISALHFDVIQFDRTGNITGVAFESKINANLTEVYLQYMEDGNVVECKYKHTDKSVELVNKVVHTGLNHPTFAIIHNTSFDDDECSRFPKSILAGVIDQLKVCDDIFHSLDNEFKTSIKKLFVSPDLMDKIEITMENGEKRKVNTIDKSKNIYSMATTLSDMDEKDGFKEVSFEIRMSPHEDGLLLAMSLVSAGSKLGSNYFSFSNNEVSIQTATQVHSAKGETFRHRMDLINGNTYQLRKLFRAILYFVDKSNVPDFKDILVGFDDSLLTDVLVEREKASMLVQSGIVSKEWFMQKHLNMSPEEIERELERMSASSNNSDPNSNTGEDIEGETDPNEDEEIGASKESLLTKIKNKIGGKKDENKN